MYKPRNKIIDEIELKNLNVSTFYDDFLSKNTPVLITKIFDHIPSLSQWSIRFLTKKLGNKIVRVNTSSTEVFDIDPKTGCGFSKPIDIAFKDYINAISNIDCNAKKLYMMQSSIYHNFPELQSEIKFDKYLPSDLIEVINLWISPGNNTTPLHYDFSNNFFMQLFGNKKMWLYDPMQFYNLYPNSCFSKAPHTSKINAAKPDIIKYPKVLKTKPIEINIPAGNILFIPTFWWHQVYSIDTSISVNIWCNTNLRQKFVPGYFHSVILTALEYFQK